MQTERNSRTTIAVIGAGISGLTTAIHLQEARYRTTIHAPLIGNEVAGRESMPSFASLYPAACLLPHSVEMPDLTQVFRVSQNVFDALSKHRETGVRWQRHYEFGDGPGFFPPDYSDALKDLEIFGENNPGLPFQKIFPQQISGWGASILFAEMAPYVEYLLNRYQSSGGRIERVNLRADELAALPADGIVNCTGLWSRDLFDDQSVYPIRGRLVLLEETPFPPPRNPLFSYNYTPSPDLYLYDVYFFPRTDGWLLGGSREPGVYMPDGTWQFPPCAAVLRDGIPSPILDLNRNILMELTGIDVMQFRRKSFAGFRPGRTGGVRLEAATEFGRLVVHNYGHGGAGVALSWGCAERVRELLSDLL